jgi:putative ABC transport system permease protein
MIGTRLWRHFLIGVKDVRRHKLRSLLTILGVVFGVASVVAMLAVGEGASRQALNEIRKLGSQNIIVTSVKPVEEEQSGNRPTYLSVYGLLQADEDRIRETIPHVRRTVPARTVRKEGRLGERSMELRVVGTTPAWFDLVRREMLAGRPLRPDDESGGASVCVLTESGARRLLAGSHSVGEAVRIGPAVLEVVGIVRSAEAGGAVQAPDLDIDAYIPMSTLRARFGDVEYRVTSGSREMEKVELHQILAEVDELANVEPVAAAVESMLQRFHRRADFRVNVPLALLRQAEATRRTFNVVLGSIAGISLLVGGIGIMNIMLASVTERTREIGIRRAVGARKRQIVAQFLVETVVLSGAGGVIGLLVGVATPLAITAFSGMPTHVPLYSLVLSFGISVGIGIVFGLYPAVRAANLDPVEALRRE